MQYLNKRFSVNGPQTTAGACEACVYGRGKHEVWCDETPDDPTVGSPANDADLELLRPPMGAAAEPPVSGAGAGAGAQVPEVWDALDAEWNERIRLANARRAAEDLAGLNDRNIYPGLRADYVPAVGGCPCGGKNG